MPGRSSSSAAALLALSLLVSCQSLSVREAIGAQLRQYPQSRVQDIYKNFCQDALGPGHLILNQENAHSYLLSELAVCQSDTAGARYSPSAVRVVPVGDKGNYLRVDLSVVLDSLVDAETLFSAFVRSANEGKKLTEGKWKAKWAEVASAIRTSFPGIPDAEKDLAAIDSLIAQGHLILHHSRAFSEAYHPHYRIVAKEIYEKELKRFIPLSP